VRRTSKYELEKPQQYLAQKSLPNTKVSARQLCVLPLAKKSTANKRKEHNVEKYIQWVTSLSLTIQVYLIRLAVAASQIPRNSPKIRTYSNSWSSNVIDLGANRKCICDFLLVINNNFDRVSQRFRDSDAFISKIASFPPQPCCLTPPSGGTPCDINVICTPLKSTLNGL